MSRTLSTAIAALALGICASSASASDLGGLKDGTRSDTDYTPHAAAFVGLGVGLEVGGQFTNIAISDGPFSFDGIGADGLVGGATLEYLFPMGRFRVGPYAEGGFSNVNTRIELGPIDGDLATQDYYFGGGLKIGYMIAPVTMIYGRGGYEWSQWSSDFISDKANVGSGKLGVGIESMATDHLSVGLGLDYSRPLSVDIGGDDYQSLLEDTESFRGVLRFTYRQ